ncbi:MAG: type II secretion system GspH family protein [Thiomicrorhabdus sp.]|nr:type II secretion system GspH family protein [Thiomicrorhabdus sp.]
MKYFKMQKGFTLVELAVVLGIVSVLAVGSVALFSEQKANVDIDMSSAKLEAAKVALIRFAEKNDYLPCPDENVVGQSGFGFENRTALQASFAAQSATLGTPAQAPTATNPFIPAIPAQPAQPARTENVDTCTVDSGTLPFEMLGLSLSDVRDSFGNLFQYSVTGGVDVAANIANCPVDSACFFNRNRAPAFNLTTEPVAGSIGVNNLTVCSGLTCVGSNLLGDGLIAVLVAHNQDGFSGSMSGEEAENQDGDQVFVQKRISLGEGDYFDDLLVSISGAELKRGEEKTYQKESVAEIAGGTALAGNDLIDMGDNSVGGSGTNVGTDEAIWDRVNQSFDFGVAAANQEVVLTYNTYVVGAWDQPETTNSNVTSDQGTVTSNNTLVKYYDYDHTVDNFDGVVQVSFVAGSIDPDVTGETYTLVDTYNANGEVEPMQVTEGVTYETYQPYWNDSAEIILTTDENGQIDLEFAVGTTATIETIDFTDIELVYYNTPPPIPNFPSVAPISGIPQTEGL